MKTNYQLKFPLGGDIKVLHLMHNVLTALDHLLNDYKLQYMLIILGLNAENSNYACIWCHIPKEKGIIVTCSLTKIAKPA